MRVRTTNPTKHIDRTHSRVPTPFMRRGGWQLTDDTVLLRSVCMCVCLYSWVAAWRAQYSDGASGIGAAGVAPVCVGGLHGGVSDAGVGRHASRRRQDGQAGLAS